MHGFLGALPALQLAMGINQYRLTRFHVAQHLEAQRVDGHAFGGNQILGALGRIVTADDQRPDPVRIAKGKQAVSGNHGDHSIGATNATMDTRYGLENGFCVDLIFGGRGLQLMGQHIEQHLRVGVGVHVAQVLQEHVLFQVFGIGQIAVVRQHQTKRRVDVKRLRFCGVECRARGRITTMTNAPISDQVEHVAGTKNVAHQSRALVHVKASALRCRYAGGILPAML